ncbi:potassium-transporting ATPase subunit C [Oxyplasma meridianum]|uniref:Potassium-transporting ATPase KdpC subunit n=1 Tax=Oxyplasma meridianum TaxID=3073602 RepID=A0AAX4NGE4_9ARCH
MVKKDHKYRFIWKSAVFVLLFLFLLGFVFPTVTAVITDKALPWQSDGEPVEINGTVYDSAMLARAFNNSFFFQPRPSAIDYNLSESGSTSYSLGNPALLNQTEALIQQFLKENPTINVSQIPYAMVSYSGSGLDPDIPLQGAIIQIPRIAVSIHELALKGNVDISNQSVSAFLNHTINSDKFQNFPIFGSYEVSVVSLNFAIINYMIGNGVISSSFLN